MDYTLKLRELHKNLATILRATKYDFNENKGVNPFNILCVASVEKLANRFIFRKKEEEMSFSEFTESIQGYLKEVENLPKIQKIEEDCDECKLFRAIVSIVCDQLELEVLKNEL